MEFLIRTPECAFPTFILYPLGQRAEAHADEGETWIFGERRRVEGAPLRHFSVGLRAIMAGEDSKAEDPGIVLFLPCRDSVYPLPGAPTASSS